MDLKGGVKMKHLVKIVNSLNALVTLAKRSVLDFRQGFKYAHCKCKPRLEKLKI